MSLALLTFTFLVVAAFDLFVEVRFLLLVRTLLSTAFRYKTKFVTVPYLFPVQKKTCSANEGLC